MEFPLPPSPPHAPHKRLSEIMHDLLDTGAQGETVSIGHILHAFGVHGFAFLLLMLSLLNIVIFMVPLISILFGLPMVILAAQMVLGLRAPIFPHAIRRRAINRAAFRQGLERAIYGIEKIERYIKPRFLFLTDPVFHRVHGVFALALAIMVTLPIPVFNTLPSVALALLAIGLLQRDGIFILLAYASGIGCLFLFRSLDHFAHLLARGA